MSFDIWTTRDGRKIPIKDMEESHIKRTLNLLLDTKTHLMKPVRIFQDSKHADEIHKIAADRASASIEWINAFKNELASRVKKLKQE